jgi:hypothetical protein
MEPAAALAALAALLPHGALASAENPAEVEECVNQARNHRAVSAARVAD